MITLLGFSLFILGFTSLTLDLVGIRWQFLSWLYEWSPEGALIAKIGMIVVGLIMVLLSKTNYGREST